VYLVGGRGFCEGATLVHRELTPGDCLVVFPNLWLNYGPQPGHWWEEYYLFFDGPLPEALEAQGRISRRRQVLRPGLDPMLREPFDRAVAAAAAGRFAEAHESAFAALARVLAAAPRAAVLPPTRLAAVAERLCADPGRAWSFPAVAAELGLTYDGFRRAFRRQFRLAPGAYLARERLHRACHLLNQGQRVREVCRAVGMGDPFHFSRRFKAAFGTSPRAYVRGLREAWQAVTH
jgi:AraC-like DNA-binding protein